MPNLRLGILPWSQSVAWAELLDVGRRVERLGYQHVWAWDHLFAIFGDPAQPIFEGWQTLAAWAMATEKVQIGLMVGANTFRNPGLVAKTVTTLDHISGGRAILGLGGAWFEPEHTAHGIPFGRGFGERLDWLDESVAACRTLLDGGTVTSAADAHYTFRELHQEPLPVQKRLPIMIGGTGRKKTLRTVARYADMWNAQGTPAELAEFDAILKEHCLAVGRDEREIERTGNLWMVIRDTEAEARSVWAAAMVHNKTPLEDSLEPSRPLLGPPAAIAERLREMVAVGFESVIVEVPAPYDIETLERLIGEVKPLVDAVSAARPRVFVSRRIPEEGLLAVAEFADAEIWPDDLPPPREELLRRVAGVDGLLALLTDRVDDELLDAAGPQLRVVSNYAVGFDNVDVPACTRRGVAVGNTPGVLTETTADLAFALLMAAARRLTEGYDYVRADRWKTWGPLLLQGTDVHHATLGIIGFGRIGREMARRAAGFDMTVLYHDAVRASLADEAALRARSVSLDELLAASDFISLHVNLTPETRGMMGRDAFRKMKPTAIVINTSRGPVVDPGALYEALRDAVIGGAALDVTDPEPMRADDPLLTLPNCLVVPHIASASRATRARMAEIAAANLLAGLRGEALPAPVNPEVAPRR